LVTVRTATIVFLRVVVLGLLLWGLYAIDFVDARFVEDARTAPFALFLVSLLQAAVLSYAVLRSRWRGWRLIGAIALAFYGISVLMVVIEAVYLPDALPLEVVYGAAANGAITVTIFATVAVLGLGRLEGREALLAHNCRAGIPWTQWLWRLALIGLGYAVLYVFFGACVFLPLARRLAPDDLARYAALEMPAWVLPFQVLRAVLWAALTLPVIQMLEGRWSETGLVVALLYAVLMGASLLRPTGLPLGLRMAHLVEVTGANFAFGWLVAALLYRRKVWAGRKETGA
jgi:hypothetical protein